MQNRARYEFATIRLMPKVEREEFLNVGVIVFAKTLGYLSLKYTLDENRIHSFSSEVDIDMVKSYLDAWTKIADGSDDAGPIGKLETPSRFRWLTASKDTIIQCSTVHQGLCTDPKKVLEEIFTRNVL